MMAKMAVPPVLYSPGPYHIISYGTILGTTFFHTFVNSVASFKVLERSQFSTLQRTLFPVYFGMQTVLPVVVAITYPGSRRIPGGFRAVLDRSNRWTVLVPLATAFLTGLVNLAYFLPATNDLTAKRKLQERKDIKRIADRKDGKKLLEKKRSGDAPAYSGEMQALNKKFALVHGASTVVNLVTFIATVAYGFTLSSRIQ